MKGVEMVDLQLGGRRVLRLAMDGERIVISEGFGEGGDFNRPGWLPSPLVLPSSKLAALRDALAQLEGSC